jgi:hypothetical protein
MASRPPKNRVIVISLDADNNFVYKDLFDGTDASSLVLIKGDRLAWTLDSSISPQNFQVDFDVVNPFMRGRPVSLRGNGSITAPPLDFPFDSYSGNRILKYTVTLGNGWFDDPDVVPSPGDPVATGLEFHPKGVIAWVDPNTQDAIMLTPPDMTADATDAGGFAQVTWVWDKTQPNPQPFSLQFEPNIGPGIPSGWPTAEQDSTFLNGIPTIQLYLPEGYSTATSFTLTTMARNGNEISIQGTLLVS